MPINTDQEPRSSISQPNSFENLQQLDEYASKPRYQIGLEGLLRYTPRNKSRGSTKENCGKLLLCHDYKGGYNENPSSLAYTFNFWDRCDTFIYFSHQRVSVPPPAWVNAAHRQGVKIIGVLIFEHQESMEDTLRLLIGNIPQARAGQRAGHANNGLPITRHYARLLADLAHERGFDGYLLNFEFPFIGRSEQARAVESWVSLLNTELKKKVGVYAETIWYDSVITTGALRWQDRLNSRNLSFFLASDSFFTNYTWPAQFPSLSAQYFLGLDSKHLQGSNKSLQDVYIGIDVWGRGSHGGGGLGSFRAAEHIDPTGLGLSIALFGPAWTWESDEGKEGWNWEKWWERERTLWVGPAIEGAHVEVPEPPLREGEQPCPYPHSAFRPMREFFDSKPPPKPDLLPFCTSFCPGVGHAWFVDGKKVMHKEKGWTDIDKQTSLGNLLWPRPKVEWDENDSGEALPKVSTKLMFEDAFNSGSSVVINISAEESPQEGTAFRCLWIPVQSIAMTPGGLYEVELVYKVSSDNSVELDAALSAKAETAVEISPVSSLDLENGWSRLSVTCKPIAPASAGSSSSFNIVANIGIILAVASEDASLPYTIDITLGQLSVLPKSPLTDLSSYSMRLLWVDHTREAGPNPNSPQSEILIITWESCISYTSPAIVGSDNPDPEVLFPPWTLDRSPHWIPRLQYANIYAEKGAWNIYPSQAAVFLGTSGWGSGAHTGAGPDRFVLERSTLPEKLRDGKVRFYVQAVTDRGSVLPWGRCAFVDLDL
ncbi:hypothetical protein ACEPAI_6587 [Sanghuangporus weigelae]